jgi:DNA-binding transcriptional ArsR family regulator
MVRAICEETLVDAERVARARGGMKPERTLAELGETFKVLGDATRVRILHALALEELCVCDLSALLALTPSAISHQLRLLRTAKLLRSRRDGKMVYYKLDDGHIRNLLEEGLRHVEEG